MYEMFEKDIFCCFAPSSQNITEKVHGASYSRIDSNFLARREKRGLATENEEGLITTVLCFDASGTFSVLLATLNNSKSEGT